MYYNVQRKVYPDGTVQLLICDKVKQRDTVKDIENKHSKHDGSTVERKKIDNMKRARQKVFDLCRSNHFDWFVTLTLNKEIVDRYDYDACRNELKKFTKWLTENEYEYVIVPEQHKDGAYHFHGLIQGDLDVTEALDSNNNIIQNVYWVKAYSSGYTTATKIKDDKRVSTYITKYLAKDMTVPKGRKRYWASQGLTKPIVNYECVSDIQGFTREHERICSFHKEMPTEYGNYTLLEYQDSKEEK